MVNPKTASGLKDPRILEKFLDKHYPNRPQDISIEVDPTGKAEVDCEVVNGARPIKFYPWLFRIGARFPFSRFQRRFFMLYGLAPCQYTPNSYKLLLGFEKLTRFYEIELGLAEFRSLFRVCPHENGRVYVVFQGRENKRPNLFTNLDRKEGSHTDDVVIVSGNWGDVVDGYDTPVPSTFNPEGVMDLDGLNFVKCYRADLVDLLYHVVSPEHRDIRWILHPDRDAPGGLDSVTPLSRRDIPAEMLVPQFDSMGSLPKPREAGEKRKRGKKNSPASNNSEGSCDGIKIGELELMIPPLQVNRKKRGPIKKPKQGADVAKGKEVPEKYILFNANKGRPVGENSPLVDEFEDEDTTTLMLEDGPPKFGLDGPYENVTAGPSPLKDDGGFAGDASPIRSHPPLHSSKVWCPHFIAKDGAVKCDSSGLSDGSVAMALMKGSVLPLDASELRRYDASETKEKLYALRYSMGAMMDRYIEAMEDAKENDRAELETYRLEIDSCQSSVMEYRIAHTKIEGELVTVRSELDNRSAKILELNDTIRSLKEELAKAQGSLHAKEEEMAQRIQECSVHERAAVKDAVERAKTSMQAFYQKQLDEALVDEFNMGYYYRMVGKPHKHGWDEDKIQEWAAEVDTSEDLEGSELNSNATAYASEEKLSDDDRTPFAARDTAGTSNGSGPKSFIAP